MKKGIISVDDVHSIVLTDDFNLWKSMLTIFIYLVSFLFMNVLGMEVNARRLM